ncbi:hypothetical protein SODALDRAFT_354382 [Sodiomyces alkalinus F11]|uniref:Uncharacterized protein n=1 Tax=Sodiomyces alkalinus (strain CBS 110278 / VKM F-3762 / F11) TaxID=1314773 RepID=A0A3N2Q6K8_SODAK|nr:hypothetical protein SODALDRAFT_354382 [Sodiomyces alkalinus F11]ROT42255.1 hypothetical protein SODALDRAFT_354382 [Sodiomyces alkalinus F11]
MDRRAVFLLALFFFFFFAFSSLLPPVPPPNPQSGLPSTPTPFLAQPRGSHGFLIWAIETQTSFRGSVRFGVPEDPLMPHFCPQLARGPGPASGARTQETKGRELQMLFDAKHCASNDTLLRLLLLLLLLLLIYLSRQQNYGGSYFEFSCPSTPYTSGKHLDRSSFPGTSEASTSRLQPLGLSPARKSFWGPDWTAASLRHCRWLHQERHTHRRSPRTRRHPPPPGFPHTN